MNHHDSDSVPPGPDGPPEATTPPTRTSRLPLVPILVLLVLGAVLLVVGLLTGGNEHAPATTGAPQALTILEPTDSAQAEAPLEVLFTTQAPLRLSAGGWQAGTYHLHALLDGSEIMPGALDIRYQGDHRFRWRIKAAPPGAHTLRLVWARPDHRSIPEGASEEVSFELK